MPLYGCINVTHPYFPNTVEAHYTSSHNKWGKGIWNYNYAYGCQRLDTGDMILQESIPLAEDETGGSLHDKLASLGARLIVEALDKLKEGLQKGFLRMNHRPHM